MALVQPYLLPAGWTEMKSLPSRDLTRVGRPGRWTIQVNDDYMVSRIAVNYTRSDAELADQLRIDDLFSFFVNFQVGAFLVDDVFDDTDSMRNGSGTMQEINGIWRLMKDYPSNGQSYLQPITRPNTVVLASGSLGAQSDGSASVSGGTLPATWAGTFYKPMIFSADGLSLVKDPSGLIKTVSIELEENLEV